VDSKTGKTVGYVTAEFLPAQHATAAESYRESLRDKERSIGSLAIGGKTVPFYLSEISQESIAYGFLDVPGYTTAVWLILWLPVTRDFPALPTLARIALAAARPMAASIRFAPPPPASVSFPRQGFKVGAPHDWQVQLTRVGEGVTFTSEDLVIGQDAHGLGTTTCAIGTSTFADIAGAYREFDRQPSVVGGWPLPSVTILGQVVPLHYQDYHNYKDGLMPGKSVPMAKGFFKAPHGGLSAFSCTLPFRDDWEGMPFGVGPAHEVWTLFAQEIRPETRPTLRSWVGTWLSHAAFLRVSAQGHVTLDRRVYQWCGPGVQQPCDQMQGNSIRGGVIIAADIAAVYHDTVQAAIMTSTVPGTMGTPLTLHLAPPGHLEVSGAKGILNLVLCGTAYFDAPKHPRQSDCGA